ncbi:hypothetical protein Tco_0954277 [Tanacetum coccineum]|uniref:Uncharacterized protein n=1 Tax=Tanacetum coccineum TaxID=301880 RepID=A0ABQ5E2Z3_9ASTR
MVNVEDPKKKGLEGGSSELKLDIYDPLYLHPQDICSQLITFKLEGTKDYKLWSATMHKFWAATMQLALHTRNKNGFINGCVSPDLYKGQVFCKNAKNVWDELKETYDKRDGSFLIGLDDVFNSVRSLIITTEPIPNVKSAFATLSRDESHRNSHYSSKNVKAGPFAFAVRPINANWNSNRNTINNNNNNKKFGRVSNLVCKHCNMNGHIIDRCYELVGYPPGFKKGNVDQSDVNNVNSDDKRNDHSKSTTHTLTSDQYHQLMSLLSDIGNTSKTHASVAVAHPNGTVEQVKQLGNFKLGNNLIVKDVLVVPGYQVSLLLGHPSDQVLVVLKDRIKDLSNISSGPCDVCHKAKQTREPLKISDHKSKSLGELVHLDVWGPYRVTSREGFRLPTVVLSGKSLYELVYGSEPSLLHLKTFGCLCFSTVLNESDKFGSSSQESNEPYDDGGDSPEIGNKSAHDDSTRNSRVSIVDDNVTSTMSSRKDTSSVEYATKPSVSEGMQEKETKTLGLEGLQSIVLNDDDVMSEGEDLESFGQLFGWLPEPVAGQTIRRTSKKFVLPTKYNEYVLNKNAKFGIDKVVNYVNLSFDNYVFTTSLNKINEPTTYLEAVKDSRWVDAINQEMEALNRNETWEIMELPSNRRAIGSKWVYKW